MDQVNLSLKGTVEVLGKELPDIAGGFGGDKRSMLAKDIADFHDKETWKVNRAINNNSKRFKDGVDIINLKKNDFAQHLVQRGFLSQPQVNASDSIYLLSERGYSKLLKVFEDDLSWEMYDRLLDNYYEMEERAKKFALDVPETRAEALRLAADLEEQNESLEKHKGVLDKTKKSVIKDFQNRDEGVSLQEFTDWVNQDLENHSLTREQIIKALTGKRKLFMKTKFGQPYKKYRGHWFLYMEPGQELPLIKGKYINKFLRKLCNSRGNKYEPENDYAEAILELRENIKE